MSRDDVNNEDKFLAAQHPDTFKVLGVRLHTYTLGHEILLRRLRCPFLCPGREPGPGDLTLAIEICRRGPIEAARKVDTRGMMLRVRFGGMHTKAFHAGLIQFHQYLRASRDSYDVWQEAGGTEAGAPFLQLVKVTLMSHLGLSEREALERGFSLARLDYAAVWELEGRLPIVGDSQRSAMAEAKRLHEEMMAMRAGKG